MHSADLDADGDADIVVTSGDAITVLDNQRTQLQTPPTIGNGSFGQGLTGWNTEIVGHQSNEQAGSVIAQSGFAQLVENESFLVSANQDIVIPANPQTIEVDLLSIGLEDPAGGIPDAFEISILDADGNSLLPTFRPDATSVFNVNPGDEVSLATGVTFDGTTVSIDISSIPEGTEATLYLDLIGNGPGNGSTVTFDNVRVTPEDEFDSELTPTTLEGPFVNADQTVIDDVDGDGRLDISAIETAGNTLLVFNGQADGSYDREEIDLSSLGDGFVSLDAAPLTAGDGVSDLVVLADGTNVAISPLVGDETPPNAELVSPVANMTNTGDLSRIDIRFDEPMRNLGDNDSMSVTNPDNYTVTFNGADGVAGTADDQTLGVVGISYEPLTGLVSLDIDPASTPLEDGVYVVTLNSLNLKDRSDNVLNDGAPVTFEFTMNSEGPVIAPIDPLTGTEGSIIDLFADFTDAGGAIPYDASIDWGDGSVTELNMVDFAAGEGMLAANHIYADNGTYNITLTVEDALGVTTQAFTTATIENDVPVATPLVSTVDAVRNVPLTIDFGDFVDAGFNNINTGTTESFTALIEWGDGSSSAGVVDVTMGMPGTPTTGTISGEHTWSQEGQYTVTVTIADDDGGEDSFDVLVNVENDAPEFTSVGTVVGNEGQTVTLVANFEDQGPDDGTYTSDIDWGDGTSSTGTVTFAGGSGTVTAEHVYGDNGTWQIAIELTDQDGNETLGNTQALIGNIAPTIDSVANQTIDVTEAVSVPTIGFTDPGIDVTGLSSESFEVDVEWGDGSTDSNVPFVLDQTSGQSEGSISGLSHNYGSPGVYPVTVTVRDDDNGVVSTSFTVTVNDVAPTIDAISPISSDEGSVVDLVASFTDGRVGQSYSASVEWGDGSSSAATVVFANGVGEITSQHVYADNGNYPVEITLLDGANTVVATTTAIVSNVSPEFLTQPSDTTIDVGDTLLIEDVEFSDPGFTAANSAETFDATIDWGDGGSSVGTITVTAGDEGQLTLGLIDASYTFGSVGVYEATITLSDDDGGTAAISFDVEVVGEPAGGKTGSTRFFVVDKTADRAFRYDNAGGYNGDFDTVGANNARGAATWTTGNPLYVVDQDRHVYVYDSDGETLLGSWKAGTIKNPEGIATDGSSIWIVDKAKKTVYFYEDAASLRSGSLNPTSSFKLDNDNKNPAGLTTDGTRLWVVDQTDDAVYIYDLNGNLESSWDLDPANRNARGITIDPSGGDGIWVVDKVDDAVYAYATATPTGNSQAATGSFALHPDNHNPEGIADPVIPISYDEVVSGTISTAGEVVEYTFEGTAGDEIFFDAIGGLFNVTWSTTSPSGGVLYNTRSTIDAGAIVLPESGTYTLTVGTESQTQTGDFGFRLWEVPENATLPVQLDTVVTGTRSVPGEVQTFSFEGMAGQEVFFDAIGGLFNVTWTTTSPGGPVLYSTRTTTDAASIALPENGTYTITVGAANQSQIGDFGFRIWEVPQNVTVPVQLETNVSATRSVPGEIQTFSFDAVAGQQVFFDAIGGLFNATWSATTPGGATLFSTRTTSDAGAIDLPETGTYTITVGAANQSQTGDFGFRLWEVPQNETTPIQLGTVESENRTVPGELFTYSFDAVAGQDVYFDAISGQFNMVWSATSPDGTVLFSTRTTTDGGKINLPDTGTYTITVGVTNSAQLGDFSFAVWDVPPNVTTPIGLDEVIVGTSSPAQVSTWSFEGNAGASVFFDTISGNSAFNWSIISPSGATFLQSNTFESVSATELPETGTYFVQLGSSTNLAAGQFSFAVRNSSLFYYVDWTEANPTAGTASGVINLPDGSTVDIGFESINEDGSPGTFFFANTDGGTNYWNPEDPYLSSSVPNSPPDSDIVSLVGGQNQTYRVTLSEPIKDPIMAVLSLGNDGNTIQYDFDTPFELVSQGSGYWGGDETSLQQVGNSLIGTEGHGTIRFTGTYDEFSWEAPFFESWHGFTFGIRTTEALEPNEPEIAALPDADATFNYSATSFNRQTQKLCVDFSVTNESNEVLANGAYALWNNFDPAAVTIDTLEFIDELGYVEVLDTEMPTTGLLPGESTTPAHLVIDNPNRDRFSFVDEVAIELNRSPSFVSTPTTSIEANSEVYVYGAQANDLDGDQLTYALLESPADMSIDVVSGDIEWTPDQNDLGVHRVTLRVSDGRGGFDEQSFDIVVTGDNINRPPQIVSNPSTYVEMDNAFAYLVDAEDADSDVLTYSLLDAPDGMTIDSTTGEISWLPLAAAVGLNNVAVLVEDGNGGVDTQNFEVEVGTDGAASISGTKTTALLSRERIFVGHDINTLASQFGGTQEQEFAVNLANWLTNDTSGSLLLIQSATDSFRNYNPNVVTALEDAGFSVTITLDVDQSLADLQAYDAVFTGISFPVPQVVDNQALIDYVESGGGVYLFGGILNLSDAAVEAAAWDPFLNHFGLAFDPTGYNGFGTVPVDSSHPVLDGITSLRSGFGSRLIDLEPNNAANEILVTAQGVDLYAVYETSTQIGGLLTEGWSVYLDLNENGVRDPSEPATLTDVNGSYTFDNLKPGTYVVAEELASGWDALNPSSGQQAITVAPGEVRTDVDFVNATNGINQNLPPRFISSPETSANANSIYVYDAEVFDAESDDVTFSLVNAPSSATINSQTGVVTWVPADVNVGNQWEFLIEAIDATGNTQQQAFAVDVQAGASGPVFVTSPVRIAVLDEAYQYNAIAEDPDGDSVYYRLIDGPTGMTIDSATGEIAWTPTAADEGVEFTIQLEAIDATGRRGFQAYTLLARSSNQAPIFVSTPEESVSPGVTYRYQADANDLDGDQVTYALEQSAPEMTIAGNGLITYRPTDANLGQSFDIRIVATDEFGLSTAQEFTLSVEPDSQAPDVDILFSNSVIVPGDTVTIQVNATDELGVESIAATIDGVAVTLDAANQFTYTATESGLPVVVATATDAAGNVGTAERKLRVVDPDDVEGPFVQINSPVIASQVTYLTDVAITVTADDLLEWKLEYSLKDRNAWTEFASGTDEVSNEVVGTFDPTILQNDEYDIRVSALDINGNIRTEKIFIGVEGQAKLGNYRLEFTDLSIPLAGIPIQIVRQYDTLNANESGDFGFGWNLAFAEANIRETIPVSDLELAGVPPIFGGSQGFFEGTRVYITTPEGQRVSFSFTPEPSATLLGTQWTPKFTADVDTDYELEVPKVGLSQNADGTFGLYLLSGFSYNPREFTLVSKDQIRYTYDQFDELQTITDRNDVELEYRDDGIFSSTGESIQFVRDAQGRITSIIDPLGNAIEYEYDADGDLVKQSSPADCGCAGGFSLLESTMTYSDEHAHFLETVTGPRGNLISQVKYDEDGRFIGVFDALGNEVIQEYDIPNNTFFQTDAIGNRSELTYDVRGNITEIVDANGNTSSATYDDPRNAHLETSVTDPRGITTEFSYDEFGNMTEVREVDRTTSIEYNERNDITRIEGPTPLNPDPGFVPTFVTMSYDANGNLETFTNAEGETESFVNDFFGRILSVTDARNNTMELEYGNFKDPDLIRFADGSERSTVRNDKGQIQSATNEVGEAVEFNYDESGRPLGVIDALGREYTNIYDEDLLVRTIDPLGRETSFEYDDKDRLVNLIDPNGGEVTRTYDPNNRLLSQTNQIGQTESWTYSPIGETLTYTNTAGDVTQYTYDAFSNLESITNDRGFVTSYAYDDLNRLTSVTDALNQAELYTYDERDNLLSITDRNGGGTLFEYDNVSRLLSTTDALNGIQRWFYDDAGNNTSYQDERGNTTLFEYDVRDRLSKQVDAAGFEQLWVYDDANRLSSYTDQEGNAYSYSYDGNNQLLSVTDPLNGLVQFGYDLVGNRVTTTDELSRVTTREFDALDRVSQVTAADGSITSFSYDAIGNLLSLTDPEQNTTLWQYNDRNDVELRTDPLGNFESYSYDEIGNLSQSIDRLGRITEYVYDGLNRLTSEIWKASDGSLVQTYDYNFDANSNLLGAGGPNSTYSFVYDALDRVTSVDNAGTPNIPNVVLNYDYDAFGNLTQIQDNSGVTVDRAFDVRNLLSSIDWSGGGVDDARVEHSYDGRGLLTGINRINGLAGGTVISTTSNTFDALGRITDITHLNSSASVVANYAFDFDAASQMTQQIINGDTSDYGYDDVGQLTEATNSARPDEVYTYDENGNRISGDNVIGPNNQLLSDGTYDYTYDAEGNLVQRTEIATGEYSTYEFDHRNRMVASTTFSSGGIILSESSYTYDVFDRMIARTVDADGAGSEAPETTYTVYDGENAWADFDEAGSVIARYLFGEGMDSNIARWRPGEGTAWYLTDHLGSVRDIIDAVGSVINHIEYDSFGNILLETNPNFGDRFKFTGREWRPELGFYYYRARFYDPISGKFVSQDPIGFLGQDSNLQRYVANNTLIFTDPTGNITVLDMAANGIKLIRTGVATAGGFAGIGIGFTCGVLEAWFNDGVIRPGEAVNIAYSAAVGGIVGAGALIAAGASSTFAVLFGTISTGIGALTTIKDIANAPNRLTATLKVACFVLETAVGIKQGVDQRKTLDQRNRALGAAQREADARIEGLSNTRKKTNGGAIAGQAGTNPDAAPVTGNSVKAGGGDVAGEFQGKFGGGCAEGRCVTNASEADIELDGSVIVTVEVGGKRHGSPKPACPDCSPGLVEYNIIDGANLDDIVVFPINIFSKKN